MSLTQKASRRYKVLDRRLRHYETTPAGQLCSLVLTLFIILAIGLLSFNLWRIFTARSQPSPAPRSPIDALTVEDPAQHYVPIAIPQE